jgi:IS5 family transposase
VIRLRRASQYSFGDGLIAEQTADLWEPWMLQADQLLEDEKLIEAVYEGLVKRHAKSRTRGQALPATSERRW